MMRYLLFSVLVVCVIGVMIPTAFAAQYGVKEGMTVIYEHNVNCDIPKELAHLKDEICIYGSSPLFGTTFEKIDIVSVIVTEVSDLGVCQLQPCWFSSITTISMLDGSTTSLTSSNKEFDNTFLIPIDVKKGDRFPSLFTTMGMVEITDRQIMTFDGISYYALIATGKKTSQTSDFRVETEVNQFYEQSSGIYLGSEIFYSVFSLLDGSSATHSISNVAIYFSTSTTQTQPTPTPTPPPTQQSKGGGCLIATAAFGSEMAPQVQFLRELRDNTILQTESGSAFMTGFNQFYYSFSPYIADYERENPAFKETVKLALTPLLTSLTLLQYVDIDSESEMLGYGIGVILLNIGMYFVAPAVLIMAVRKRI